MSSNKINMLFSVAAFLSVVYFIPLSTAQVTLNSDSPYWGDNSTTNTTNIDDNSTTNATLPETYSSNVPGDNLGVVVNDYQGSKGGVTSNPSDIDCGIVGNGRGSYHCSANFQNGQKIMLHIKAADQDTRIGSFSFSDPSSPSTTSLTIAPPPNCVSAGDNDMNCPITASAELNTLTVNFAKKSPAKLVLLDASLDQKSITAGKAFPGITLTFKNKGTAINILGCSGDGIVNSCSDYNVQLKLVYLKNGVKYTSSWSYTFPTPEVAPGTTDTVNVTNWAPVLSIPGSYSVVVYVMNENGETTKKELILRVNS